MAGIQDTKISNTQQTNNLYPKYRERAPKNQEEKDNSVEDEQKA